MAGLFDKDPDATLDYGVDWTKWLGVDNIASSEWSVPTGITLVADELTAKTATVWLSGGTAGQSYRITNRVVTSSVPARVDERSMTIRVVER